MSLSNNSKTISPNAIQLELSDFLKPPGQTDGATIGREHVWARLGEGQWIVTRFQSIDRAERYISKFASTRQAMKSLTEEEE